MRAQAQSRAAVGFRDLGDVNPPVHAWAGLRVFRIDGKMCGEADYTFLVGERRLLSIVGKSRLVEILQKMLDEPEFRSPHGLRAVSRVHAARPYVFDVMGTQYRVEYEPPESSSGLFGGNSNWRGPVWFPLNFLLIEALQKFHHYYGDDLKLECPTGSSRHLTLSDVAAERSHRLMDTFRRGDDARRPAFGGSDAFALDLHWRDYVPFYEYFHGDNGAGIGASHQTGLTGLVAKLIQQCAEYCGQEKDPLSRRSADERLAELVAR